MHSRVSRVYHIYISFSTYCNNKCRSFLQRAGLLCVFLIFRFLRYFFLIFQKKNRGFDTFCVRSSVFYYKSAISFSITADLCICDVAILIPISPCPLFIAPCSPAGDLPGSGQNGYSQSASLPAYNRVAASQSDSVKLQPLSHFRHPQHSHRTLHCTH